MSTLQDIVFFRLTFPYLGAILVVDTMIGGYAVEIAGLQKTTLLDYPGRIACTVFLPGCNLRCPFCHNASLVLHPQSLMSQDELLAFLQTRKRKLDGVCVTGGEPTLHRDLPQLLAAVKDLGFLVKLDTNGTQPQILKTILDAGLVDYVAMDIKNSPEKYAVTCGGPEVLDAARESVSLLEAGSVAHEFRTTVLHPFHAPEDLAAIGRWLSGTRHYFIQAFVDSGDLIGSGQALTEQEMYALLDAVKPHIPNAQLRGI